MTNGRKQECYCGNDMDHIENCYNESKDFIGTWWWCNKCGSLCYSNLSVVGGRSYWKKVEK